MFLFWFLLSFLLSVAESSVTGYINQRLDHYNRIDSRTFRQKYIYEDKYYKPGGPVFLVISGEAPLDELWAEYQFPVELAEEFNALVVSLEHRYYGESMPFKEYSYSKLRYLTAEQALADLVNFRNMVVKGFDINPDTQPIITFGCSYSGVLSAWARQKFPHLFTAAFSGSSPIEAELNFVEYDQVVVEALGDKCRESYKEAYSKVFDYLSTYEGRVKLASDFNSCDPIEGDDLTVAMFAYALSDLLDFSVQYNNPPDFPMEKYCSRMVTAADKYSELVSMYAEANNGDCLDYLIYQANSSVWASWYYQKATQFGFYKDFSSATSGIYYPGVDLDFHYRVVDIIFDLMNDNVRLPMVKQTNLRYGGNKRFRASNIFFTNSLRGPWSSLSLTDPDLVKKVGPNVVMHNYENAGHCSPYHGYDPKMPQDVLEVREELRKFIAGVLSQGN